MTNPNEPKPGPKPDPSAALIAYGRASGSSLPQASWFRAGDGDAVRTAAKILNLTVAELRTEADKAVALGLAEGVLKSSGRMIVGSVSPETLRRIEAHFLPATDADLKAEPEKAVSVLPKPAEPLSPVAPAPQLSPAPTPTPPAAVSGASTLPVPTERPSPSVLPWDALRVGSLVLAAYWTEEDEIEGWWPAVVTGVDATGLVLKWRDTSEYPLGLVEKKYIALLHPEYLASGE